MRPINNVVDASNYVMLELGQPTHPYDLDRLAGEGLVVRAARPAEQVTTLDGEVRTMGRAGPGIGDAGRDCLICDANGAPVAIGGVMGGASSEIAATTSRVLLEAAYFTPMAIARTSRRLALRTEASARFERGCDPAGIDRAADRFIALLARSAGPDLTLATGTIDVRGAVPAPLELAVRVERVNGLLGTGLTAGAMAELLAPLGFDAQATPDGDGALLVTVPTNRPDIRPLPMGEADVTEEVARTYGYARLPRRTPSWPQPGRLTSYQRDRRLLREVLCGLGMSEAWTSTFVTEADQLAAGFDPPSVEVTNPLVEDERFLRSSMAPGLLGAVAHNTERRYPDVRLFEIGSVFELPSDGPIDVDGSPVVASERLSAVFAWEGDDAWAPVAAWRAVAVALRLADWEMWEVSGARSRVLHDHRSAALVARSDAVLPGGGVQLSHLGVLGEIHPTLAMRFGLVTPAGRPRRIGWLDLDLEILLDRAVVVRRPEEARPVSRFPSSDIDLAFVVEESIRAGAVERTLRTAGGSSSSRSSCSTCTGGNRWARVSAASPSGCVSAPWTARSPTPRSAACARRASKRCPRRTGRSCAERAVSGRVGDGRGRPPGVDRRPDPACRVTRGGLVPVG